MAFNLTNTIDEEFCLLGFYDDNGHTSTLAKVCFNTLLVNGSSTSSSLTDTFGNAEDLDYMWVLIAGIFVFFMQSGFTMLEVGMVHHNNVQNILFKNIMDACIGSIVWYLFGFCVAYGDPDASDANEFIGTQSLVLESEDWNFYFFQWAFAATAATIVSGSVAERCHLYAYFIYTIFLAVWVYPIVVHWVWSPNGWLSGFDDTNKYRWEPVIDFGGSGVVHMVGGISGLMGAIALGPRLHRFDPNLDSALARQFKFGHNVPYQVLGTFILWFGWYGFNPGSTLAANGEMMDVASKTAVNTTLAAGIAGLTVALITRLTDGIWMVPSVCNGCLAGLVSITGSCAVVEPWMAFIIGFIGACFYCLMSNVVEKLKIDDPLDAFAVHGCGGFWGIVAVGIFGYEKSNIRRAGYDDYVVDLEHGKRFYVQLVAAIVIIAWTVVNTGVLFFSLKFLGILRVEKEVEEMGLDVSEHGGKAVTYARAYSIKKRGRVAGEKMKQREIDRIG